MYQPELRQLLAAAPRHLEDYLARTAQLSHASKGIRRSEMFFLFAAVADAQPARILESGRARAQSTLVLATLFPQAEVISIESDAHSSDVEIAAERLKDQQNVSCRFGDSRELLPRWLRAGDVVLIDGPKDFRAVKLALRLLATGKPLAVFVHDLWRGSPARDFVERKLPGVFLSDASEWVRSYSWIDRAPNEKEMDAPVAYGATLGCFPPLPGSYALHLARCNFAEGAERLREIWRKLRGGKPRQRLPDFATVPRT